MARKGAVRRHLLIYAGITPFVVIAVFPVVWMAITAFKQDADLYRMDVVPFLFHLTPTLEHFERLFTQTYFSAQLLNTLQLAASVVTITMMAAVPAGYALARLRLPGAENLGIAIFATYLVPPIVLFIPLARVVGARSGFSTRGGRRGWTAAVASVQSGASSFRRAAPVSRSARSSRSRCRCRGTSMPSSMWPREPRRS